MCEKEVKKNEKICVKERCLQFLSFLRTQKQGFERNRNGERFHTIMSPQCAWNLNLKKDKLTLCIAIDIGMSIVIVVTGWSGCRRFMISWNICRTPEDSNDFVVGETHKGEWDQVEGQDPSSHVCRLEFKWPGGRALGQVHRRHVQIIPFQSFQNNQLRCGWNQTKSK